MFNRKLFFGAVASLLGLAPMAGALASAECQATEPETLVAPLSVLTLSPAVSLAQMAEVLDVAVTPVQFQLMSPVVETDHIGSWQMPAGRYWLSLEVSEAKVAQEGVGIADEDLESWLLAPAVSVAVPF